MCYVVPCFACSNFQCNTSTTNTIAENTIDAWTSIGIINTAGSYISGITIEFLNSTFAATTENPVIRELASQFLANRTNPLNQESYTISSGSSFYMGTAGVINLNETLLNQNITLTANNLTLNFSEATDVLLISKNYTRNWTSITNISILNTNISEGKVTILFKPMDRDWEV